MKRSLMSLRHLALAAFALCAMALALPAAADPPARAARISFVSGNASFSPAGSDDWLQARINRPIWIGDRVWSGDGRVELQVGGASLRLAPRTSLQVLNFDDRIAQFEVTQGTVALHVRAIDRDDTIEIDTPSFAFVTHEEGDYRIDVEHDRTAVAARRGTADIYGNQVAYRIDRREQFAFYSPDLRDYDVLQVGRGDPFDQWARERARREDRSVSARYVPAELVGFVDLDDNGEWRQDPTYGAVWIPRVQTNWAPYRYGHWSWIDPWGWTWIDDAPWGFAPSHYGRWTRLGATWAWVPGPRDVRPVYAPALVAWVGGENFSLSVSSGRTRGVGWFPLAPGEVWRPTYDVSRDYFTRVNVANTVVNNTTVVNIYNNRNDVRVVNEYRFRSAPAAVTAVPVETFVQSRPVQLTQTQVAANATAQANVLVAPSVQPSVQSIVGSGQRVQARPPAETLQRPVVARTAPPAAVPTIEQRAALAREGKPVDREALERAAPRAAQPAPQAPGAAPAAAQAPAGNVAPGQLRSNVRVVEADKAAPKPLPPAPPEGGRAARNEADKGGRTAGQQPPGQQATPAQATPPAQPPGQQAAPGRGRGPDDERGDRGRPGQTASPPAGAPGAPEGTPRAAPPVAPTPAPAAAPPAAPAPAPAAAPPAAQPPRPAAAGRAPDADAPNVDQLRGRETPRAAPGQPPAGGPPPDADRSRGRETPRATPNQPPAGGPPAAAGAPPGRGTPPDDPRVQPGSRPGGDDARRAQPAAAPQPAPAPSRPPPEPRPAAGPQAAPAPAPQAAPAASPPPARPPEAARPPQQPPAAAQRPQPAPPPAAATPARPEAAAQPPGQARPAPAAPAQPPGQARRGGDDNAKGGGRDREKDKDKDKDKKEREGG